MFILKGMEEAVSNWMYVILVHLTTYGRNSELSEHWAVRKTDSRNSGAASPLKSLRGRLCLLLLVHRTSVHRTFLLLNMA